MGPKGATGDVSLVAARAYADKSRWRALVAAKDYLLTGLEHPINCASPALAWLFSVGQSDQRGH